MVSRSPDSQAWNERWTRSYARQALSDLNAREILASAKGEKCHRLHFLQMAAEKACKAYLVAQNGHEKVRKTHAIIERVLPVIARQFYAMRNNRNEISRWQVSQIRRLAREIELLAPACDDGDHRRDNSEYPWENAQGGITTPCEYNFPNIDDGNRSIILLIELIRTAANTYSK